MTTVFATGTYRDKTTTLRAVKRTTPHNRAYLYISKRQMQSAADRCCYAGTDWPVLVDVDGYDVWQAQEDGSYRAYLLTAHPLTGQR